MKLKYDIGQTVLIKGRVNGILVDEDGVTLYKIETETDVGFKYLGASNIIKEEKIVCGWVGDIND